MNPGIIAKYRSVDWVFAIYRGIELQSVYQMAPEILEPFFSKWEKKWLDTGGRDINNPKIPVRFVEANGKLIFEDLD